MSTAIGTFDEEGKVNIKVVKEPWLEDIYMTPYISLKADEAIKMITEKLGIDALGEAEPRYFIGTLRKLHTINVYTGKLANQ